MRRTVVGLAFSILLPLLASCGDSGRIRVSWAFSTRPVGAEPTPAYECGLHGVDSVRLARGTITWLDGGMDAGEDAGGDAGVDGGTTANWEGRWEDVTVAPCAPNEMEREVPPGVYDFMLFGVNAVGDEIWVPGHPMVLHTPVFGVEVKANQTTDIPPPDEAGVRTPLILDTSGCDGINCKP